MSLRRLLALVLASFLLTIPADGRELVFGVEQSLTADSNTFNQVENPTADGSYRIGPTVRLREKRDVINYDFFYSPQYQVYMRTDDIDGWNQTFRGVLAYRPSERNEITLDARAILRSAVQLFTDAAITGEPALVPGIGDTGHYIVDLTYRRWFTERWSGSLTGSYDQWTYTQPNAIPNVSGAGRASVFWLPTPHLQTGIDVSSVYRRFEQLGSSPASTNVVSNATVFAEWEYMETWKFILSGGPTYVATRQDAPEDRLSNLYNAGIFNGNVYAAPFANCPIVGGIRPLASCTLTDPNDTSNNLANPFQVVPVNFPPGTQTTSTNANFPTFFARAQIGNTWERGSWSLGYSRTQDASGGVGTTNIRDSVTLESSYRLRRYTTFSLYAEWSKRTFRLEQERGVVTAVQSTETTDLGNPLAQADALALVTVDIDRDILQGVVILAVAQQMTRNLKLRAEFAYSSQRFDSTVFNPGTGLETSSSGDRANRFLGRFFVRYEFDPFRF